VVGAGFVGCFCSGDCGFSGAPGVWVGGAGFIVWGDGFWWGGCGFVCATAFRAGAAGFVV
jgi:hypothetical protein